MSGYPEYSDGRGISLHHEGPGYEPHRLSANGGGYYPGHSRAQSTQSWVSHGQWGHMNPTAPSEGYEGEGEPTPHQTPARASRPLPDPQQYMQYNSHYSNGPTVLRLANADPPHSPDVDEEEYMELERDGPMDHYPSRYQSTTPTRPPVHRVPVPAPPVDFQAMRYEDVGPLRQEDPEESPRRGFVGGFWSGLRRLPRVLTRKSSKSSTTKKKKGKKGASYGEGFDEDESPTPGAHLQRGNTLPAYTENPGPNVSRPVYETAPMTPPPMRAEYSNGVNLPPSLSSTQPRRVLNVHITPPSDVDEQDEFGLSPEPPHVMPGGMMSPTAPGTIPTIPTIPEETTPPRAQEPLPVQNSVTVYELPASDDGRYSAMPRPTLAPPPETPPPIAPPVIPPPVLPIHPSPPATIRNSRSTRGGRSGSGRQRIELDSPVQSPVQLASPPLSNNEPVQAHLRPAVDYAKMGSAGSRTSYTSDLSDGPSFSEQRNPLFRFVKALWYMPWVAPKRVTVDYRPAGRGRNSKYGIAETKKPNRTWYRGTPGLVMSPTSSQLMDISSPVDAAPSHTVRRKTSSQQTRNRPLSTGTAMTRWAPAPTGHPRRREGGGHRRHGHRHRNHHRSNHRGHRYDGRRETSSSVTSATGITQFSAFRLQTPSPVLPAVYPYPYAFPYGFPPYQPQPQPQAPGAERTKSTRPGGPRAHRGETYPGGFAAYQPFVAPQPMYFMQAPSPPSSGDAGGQGHHMYVPVPMQVVPGAFNPETLLGAGHVQRRRSAQSGSTGKV